MIFGVRLLGATLQTMNLGEETHPFHVLQKLEFICGTCIEGRGGTFVNVEQVCIMLAVFCLLLYLSAARTTRCVWFESMVVGRNF